ncbi:MAG: UvrD-helicase domain-containing protein [Spirochaetota bacterium]|nr:UvrD-helicase domain-containing protein [Spirochaetota bacterium]
MDTLNQDQETALREINQPVLILAGAGSGKTRVITHKIAYLIRDQGFSPWSILAVTFTNKAAKEMRSRVDELLDLGLGEKYNPYASNALWITTFHSACARILRREISKLGYKTNFSIYDSDDSAKIIKEVIKTNKLSAPGENAFQILSVISRYKNEFQTPKEVLNLGRGEGDEFMILTGKIYEYYEKKLFENNALDFDDLIIKTIQLFEKDAETLKYYRELFRYVMVDEFQDTNHSQYKLVQLLSAGKTSISVVGDDDQSIYSWRGADVSNIINFGNDFKDCKVIKLEQNYRSTNRILDAAHSVVKHNERRLQKKLWSENGLGDKLRFHALDDDRDEGDWVIGELLRLSETGAAYKDMAVFYRMNYQSRMLEEYLRRENIPYRIFGGVKFYERMEVKDILAYLTVLVNDSDSLALKRVINVPKRGIGSTTLKKIDVISSELGIGFEESAWYCINNQMIKGAIRDKLEAFLSWLKGFRELKTERSITGLLEELLDETHYLDYIKENYDNYEDRLENIRELSRAITQYETEQPEPTLDHFLMDTALRTEIDELDEDADYVNLMTVHNSKGLEFPNVFIIGMNEGVFPHYRALDDYEDMEEERRLFYVGITRAKVNCTLSSSARQMSFGQIKFYKPSRFITEIQPDLIDKTVELEPDDTESQANTIIESFTQKQKAIRAKAQSPGSQKDILKHISEVEVGQTLSHKDFGEGTVLKVNDKGEMSTVLLSFSDGNRLLILKYANLSRVS